MQFADPGLRPLAAAIALATLVGCLHLPPAPEPTAQSTEVFLPLDDTHVSVPDEDARANTTWVDEHVVGLASDGTVDAATATAAPPTPVATTQPAPVNSDATDEEQTDRAGTDTGVEPETGAEDGAAPAALPRLADLNLELPPETTTVEAPGAPGSSGPPAAETRAATATSTTTLTQTLHPASADAGSDEAGTGCPGTEASATAQCPLDHVRMRTARAGETLIDTIGRWAVADGWQLVVETHYDWPLRTSHTTATGLDTAIRQITEAFSRTQPAPTATAYRCNCVLVVRDNAHRPG